MDSDDRTESRRRKKRTACVVWWLRVITVKMVRNMWKVMRPSSHPSLQSICYEEKTMIKMGKWVNSYLCSNLSVIIAF